MNSKKCSHCKQILLIEMFGKDKTRWDGKENKCKLCRSKFHKKYYIQNKEKLMNYNKIWNKTHAKNTKKYRMAWRNKCLVHYGGNPPKCTCCNETNKEFLVIHHSNNDGKKHRKLIKVNIYYWLVKNNFPKNFAVLCYNCNMSIGMYGYCPHRKSNEEKEFKIINRERRIKIKTLKHYGNKCACCGENKTEFLAIDHINGGGEEERKKLGIKSGVPFYRYLIRNNFPSGYRVLCHNCNVSLGLYGYCPHRHIKE